MESPSLEVEAGGEEEEGQGTQEEGREKEGTPPWGVARENDKGVAISGKMKVTKPNHQTKREDAVRKYITQHEPGRFLTFGQRQTLAADWNELIRAGCRVTIRQFAARHGLRPETWRREYHRGATGVAVPDTRDGRRRRYAEYDPFKAQDAINDNNANKGARMLVTNQMAAAFRRYVVDERLSPYDALCHMRKDMPGRRIPCLSTWYRHINAGDVGVMYGQTPYHPSRRPRGRRPHPAMTVPGRLTLDDRPAGATNRSRLGHYEMDTVVSSASGTGGLLVLIDRRSRRYVIELLRHVTQDEVVAALGRMVSRRALGSPLSVTTDNGCEFLDPEKIRDVVGCRVYYTRAYASWEKGSVENCNRFVRRWYPKGTDFGKCTRADMHRLEKVINSIHRKLLGGKTAYEFDTAYSKAA